MNTVGILFIAIIAIGVGLGAGYLYKDFEIENENEESEENGNGVTKPSFILFETFSVFSPNIGDHITISPQKGYLATFYDDGDVLYIDYNDSDGDGLGNAVASWQMDAQKPGKLHYDISIKKVTPG